jgi:hypothetical protein
VLGALLGTLALGEAAYANGGKHHHHKGQRPRGGKRRCYPGDTCVPGTAHTNTRCDFSSSNVFRNLDAQSSNLSGSNFSNADLSGADLRAVNLSDSCLVNADLTGASIDESTNFHRVLFCNTTMPDGSALNAGCDRLTGCCPCAGPTCLLGGGSPDCDKTINHTYVQRVQQGRLLRPPGLLRHERPGPHGLFVQMQQRRGLPERHRPSGRPVPPRRVFLSLRTVLPAQDVYEKRRLLPRGNLLPNGLCAVQRGGQAFCN